MVDPENFVARLRVLAQRLSPQGDAAVTAVLAAALESDPNGIEFHRRVVILIELARLARKQVAELTDDPSQQLYEEAIAGIVATLEMLDMRVNWATYAQVFNPRSLTLLETCERAVAYRLTTKQPAAEALAEALTDIQDAIKEVLDADIEPEAKQLLLEMLREVEGALLAYRLLGLAGLRRAVAGCPRVLSPALRNLLRRTGHPSFARNPPASDWQRRYARL